VQNRYTGDIGDFGKYGLLRALARDDLRLGVVWYLNPREDGNHDGSLVEYLETAKEDIYRGADPTLYHALRQLVKDNHRNVAAVRERAVLPRATLFYDEPLTFDGIPRGARKQHRESWCRRAVRAVAEADLVFLDPDHGISLNTKNRFRKRGPKHVYLDELSPYFEGNKSVIVYHHSDRSASLNDQINSKLRVLAECGWARWVFSFHRLQVRFYFVISSAAHRRILKERSLQFTEGPWRNHFKLHGLVSNV